MFNPIEYQILQPYAEALFRIPGINQCHKHHLPQDVVRAALAAADEVIPALIASGLYDQAGAERRCADLFAMAAHTNKTKEQLDREDRQAERDDREAAQAEIRAEAYYNQ